MPMLASSRRTEISTLFPETTMVAARLVLILSIISGCCALRVAISQPHAVSYATSARRMPLARLAETEKEGSVELSDEQIKAAAEKSAEPAWPEAAPVPGLTPVINDDAQGEFDPRIILYVSLPALVLLGQLFFTFSRDALGDVALGPAVMDLWMP